MEENGYSLSSLDEKVSHFIKTLECKEKISQKQEAKLADKWLTWACVNRYMMIVAAVIPEGILPDDCWGKLLDCKVFTKGLPDDNVYDNNPDIRKKVARGNCFLELNSLSGTSSKFCIIRGISKFTGGMGDDDDKNLSDELTWKSYFTKPLETVETIISTNKVNGESAHVSGVTLDGTRYWVAGSKNVHMIFRGEDDLEKYDRSLQRFSMAREISQTWLEYVAERPEDALRLHMFLTEHQLTANFEFLSPAHSHVEDLSHLDRPQLTFITWTSLDISLVFEDKEELTIFPPDTASAVAKQFGLSTVECRSLAPESLDIHLYEIRLQYNKEGEVLYFLDENHSVVGLLKKKSVWYIIVRAIREKIKGMLDRFTKQNKNFSLTTEVAKISKRLKEIKHWLKLDDDTVEQWKNLASEFAKWILTIAETEANLFREVSERFPIYWQRFLRENNLSDCVIVNQSEL